MQLTGDDGKVLVHQGSRVTFCCDRCLEQGIQPALLQHAPVSIEVRHRLLAAAALQRLLKGGAQGLEADGIPCSAKYPVRACSRP